MKALFLDRDGIINVDSGYVYKIDEFIFQDSIFELVRLFKSQGYLVFVITNQSGIGRGYYSLDDFNQLTDYMIQEFQKHHIELSSVEFCPHHPQENCLCRKPKTGMIDNILKNFDIELKNSWLFGDKQSDIDLAHNASIGYSVAITTQSIQGYTYKFDSIKEAKDFFKANIDKIQKTN